MIEKEEEPYQVIRLRGPHHMLKKGNDRWDLVNRGREIGDTAAADCYLGGIRF
jgi:hypothetical protein